MNTEEPTLEDTIRRIKISDEIRATTPPELRKAYSVLGPLIRDLPVTDALIFSEPALEAWRNLRRFDPEQYMVYRQTVASKVGRHIAPMIDERAARPALARASRVVAVEIGELLKHEFTPMEAFLSPWLRRQNLAMVHAERGIGKTYFSLYLAHAIASGGEFLGWKADKPRRVLYIDGEMPGQALKERMAAISASNPAPAEGYFRVITPDLQDGPLPDLGTLEGQEALAPLLLDAELIVIDNLSSLVRAGVENEGESWLPVAQWALARRREGLAVLFVHHDGKNGSQRGSSRREDVLDVVIQLKRPKDYNPENGAHFVVHFRKARGLRGEDVAEIEAMLTTDEQGKQVWTVTKLEEATFERVITLAKFDMSGGEIAAELGINRSTANRHIRHARETGRLPPERK